MRRYTTMPELGIWYDGMHVDRLMSYYEPADRGQVKIHIEKQRRRRTSRGAFAKLTTMAQGRPRISTDPPLRVTISDEEQADLVDHFLAEYRLTLQEDRRILFDRFTEVDTVCSCRSSRPGRRSTSLTPSQAVTTTMARA